MLFIEPAKIALNDIGMYVNVMRNKNDFIWNLDTLLITNICNQPRFIETPITISKQNFSITSQHLFLISQIGLIQTMKAYCFTKWMWLKSMISDSGKPLYSSTPFKIKETLFNKIGCQPI